MPFAIRSVRKVVDNYYIANDSTANMCAIDVSKAFDKVNHYALLSKLMKKMIPRELLFLLENWLPGCYSCVKWHTLSSLGSTLASDKAQCYLCYFSHYDNLYSPA